MTNTVSNLKSLATSNVGIGIEIVDNGSCHYTNSDLRFENQKLFELLTKTISLRAEEKIGLLKNLHTLTTLQLEEIESALIKERNQLEKNNKNNPKYLEEIATKNINELQKLTISNTKQVSLNGNKT